MVKITLRRKDEDGYGVKGEGEMNKGDEYTLKISNHKVQLLKDNLMSLTDILHNEGTFPFVFIQSFSSFKTRMGTTFVTTHPSH